MSNTSEIKKEIQNLLLKVEKIDLESDSKKELEELKKKYNQCLIEKQLLNQKKLFNLSNMVRMCVLNYIEQKSSFTLDEAYEYYCSNVISPIEKDRFSKIIIIQRFFIEDGVFKHKDALDVTLY